MLRTCFADAQLINLKFINIPSFVLQLHYNGVWGKAPSKTPHSSLLTPNYKKKQTSHEVCFFILVCDLCVFADINNSGIDFAQQSVCRDINVHKHVD